MKRFQRLRASATVDGKALLFLESPDGLFNPGVEGIGVGKVPIPAVTVAKGAQVAPQLRDFGSGFAASQDAVGIGGESFDRRDAISGLHRSEEHTSELQSLMRISYAVFCLKKKKKRLYMTTSPLRK